MDKTIKNIEKDFFISPYEIKKIIKDFHSEMNKGLSGKKSSLKMIPTYVIKPDGTEKGRFLALDLGGTNFRVHAIELKGNRKAKSLGSSKFVLQKRHITGKGEELFGFIADSIKSFLKTQTTHPHKKHKIGFTFSFPVEMKRIDSGILIRWTKGFSARGVEGKDVVILLNNSLKRSGLNEAKVVGLANDTVSTLVARSYEDPHCDLGVILGTGTNACYLEKPSKIIKCRKLRNFSKDMIINIEWGNFNKVPIAMFDSDLDSYSPNKGEQIMEKMVSGMYLGEIVRLIVEKLIKEQIVFKNKYPQIFTKRNNFKSEYMSIIEKDISKNFNSIESFLEKHGIQKSTYQDREILKKVCSIVSWRAARISATAMAAVITKRDKRLSKKHTIAIDGSVYEKHPHFANRVKTSLKDIFSKKAKNIKIALTKDASGKGAAVIAALNSEKG